MVSGSALIAAPLAMLATAAIGSLFRSRVARSMLAASGRSDAATLASSTVSPPGTTAAQVRITLYNATPDSGAAELEALQRAGRAVFRLRAIHTCAGLVFAAVATLVVFPAIPRYSANVHSVTMFPLIFATPLPLALVLLGSRSQGTMLLATAAWVTLLALAGALFGRAALALDLWLLWVGVPTAMAVLFGARRLRAAGPVLFAVTWVLLSAFLGGLFYAGGRLIEDVGFHFVRPDLAALPLLEAAERFWDEIAALPAHETDIGSILSEWRSLIALKNPERATLGAVALLHVRWFAPLALAIAATWGLLTWYARRYRRQHSSDVMLSIDTLWLTCTVGYILLTLIASARPWIAAAFILPFVAYKATCGLSLRAGKAGPSGPPLTLLFLRVFGHEGRTQRLLDALAASWRHLGPIRLIAGTDSAYASLEPHEFYEFLGGRLSRRFIGDTADLERQLRSNSAVPDPDGLYRIQDFYCHRDTWEMTVARLVRESDAILMDLRGFSEANQGCVFELRQLVWAAPLSRTLLFVDTTTDLKLLEATVCTAWEALPAYSPNAGDRAPTLRLFHADQNTRRIVRALLPALLHRDLTGSAPVPISA
jgi:hypothetical protein